MGTVYYLSFYNDSAFFMNGEWYHTYNKTVVSHQSVNDDGVVTLTVGTVSLTDAGLRP